MAKCNDCGRDDRPRYSSRPGQSGWYCDICLSPAPTLYLDETERVIGTNLPNKAAQSAIARHRLEKAEALKKMPNSLGKHGYE